jgi:hypothetical protein
MLVSCSASSSTLKMKAICSSETSVDMQRTTRRYIPEESTLVLIVLLMMEMSTILYIHKIGIVQRWAKACPRRDQVWHLIESGPMVTCYLNITLTAQDQCDYNSFQ